MGKINQETQNKTSEEESEQQFMGFEKTAGSLRWSWASVGKEAPNLAVNPTKLSCSLPSTQFLTLTWKFNSVNTPNQSICNYNIGCIFDIDTISKHKNVSE